MSKGGKMRTALSLCLALFLSVGLGVGWAADTAKPKRADNVEFAKCAVCHGEKAGLPSGHPSPTDPAKSDCLECHKKQEETSLRTKIPLSHLHEMHGVTCGDCHDSSAPPEALSSEDCLGCHGPFEDLKKKTAKTEYNPHDSHYQEALGCDGCHHAHSPGENFCAQCHDLEWKVP